MKESSENTLREYISLIIQEKKKRKKKRKHAGSYPEDAYEAGNEKNLYLDRSSTHGGWPEGEYNPPVMKQISKWLKSMKMMK